MISTVFCIKSNKNVKFRKFSEYDGGAKINLLKKLSYLNKKFSFWEKSVISNEFLNVREWFRTFFHSSLNKKRKIWKISNLWRGSRMQKYIFWHSLTFLSEKFSFSRKNIVSFQIIFPFFWKTYILMHSNLKLQIRQQNPHFATLLAIHPF